MLLGLSCVTGNYRVMPYITHLTPIMPPRRVCEPLMPTPSICIANEVQPRDCMELWALGRPDDERAFVLSRTGGVSVRIGQQGGLFS
jgi:hypothetical protein